MIAVVSDAHTLTRGERLQLIRECPEFVYSYSPMNTEADRRWVFLDKEYYGLRKAWQRYLEWERRHDAETK